MLFRWLISWFSNGEVKKLKSDELQEQRQQFECMFMGLLEKERELHQRATEEFRSRNHELESQVNDLEEQLSSEQQRAKLAQAKIEKRERQLTKRERQLETARAEIRSREEQLSSEQQLVQLAQAELEEREGQLYLQLEETLEEHERQLETDRAEIRSREEQLRSEQQLVQLAQAELEEREGQLQNIKLLRDAVTIKENKLQAMKDDIASINKALDHEKIMSGAHKEMSRVMVDVESVSWNQERERLEAEISCLREQLSSKQPHGIIKLAKAEAAEHEEHDNAHSACSGHVTPRESKDESVTPGEVIESMTCSDPVTSRGDKYESVTCGDHVIPGEVIESMTCSDPVIPREDKDESVTHHVPGPSSNAVGKKKTFKAKREAYRAYQKSQQSRAK